MIIVVPCDMRPGGSSEIPPPPYWLAVVFFLLMVGMSVWYSVSLVSR